MFSLYNPLVTRELVFPSTLYLSSLRFSEQRLYFDFILYSYWKINLFAPNIKLSTKDSQMLEYYRQSGCLRWQASGRSQNSLATQLKH